MGSLADAATGRDNHFNLIRFIAASAVLISHSYPLSLGKGAIEPLHRLTGTTLGAAAVYMFFGISGFLIAGSFERRRDIWGFLAARIARIYPGLFVVLVLTVLLLGPLVTDLPTGAYFTELATWTYAPRNMTLRFLQFDLPGVFGSNIYPGAINGSLWTLYWEVVCYGLVVVLGFAGALGKRPFAAFLAIYVVVEAICVWVGYTPSLVRLSFPFVTGMAMYVFRESIPLTLGALGAVVAVALALYFTPFWPLAYAAVLSFVALWLGHCRGPALLAYNRLGDYSYGTYIYAFPVQQTISWAFPGISTISMIVLALAATIVLAVLSWHLIEAPALARREGLAKAMRSAAAPFARKLAS